MERHLFKCTKCGHEVYLQAWRSVCPSCESGFTLVRVVEPVYEPKVRPRYFASALLIIYLAITFIAPELTITFIIPFPNLFQLLLAFVALFALSGSKVSNVLVAVLGLTLAVYHVAFTKGSLLQPLIMIITAGLIVAAFVDERIVRQKRRENIKRTSS